MRMAASKPTWGSPRYFCKASVNRAGSPVVRNAASKLAALRPLALKYGSTWARVKWAALVVSRAYNSVEVKPPEGAVRLAFCELADERCCAALFTSGFEGLLRAIIAGDCCVIRARLRRSATWQVW